MNRAFICAILLLIALVYPWIVPRFWVEGVATEAMILAIVGLSLTFMACYGGMVPLSQLTVAGVAGYSFAYLAPQAGLAAGDAYLWALAIASLSVGALAAVLISALAVRTTGVYLLMLTLAVAVGFEAFARQNYEIMRGFDGYSGIPRPPLPMGADHPTVFYYLTLSVLVASYAGLKWISRSRFGIVLQAIRDDVRRAASLGFRTDAHRIAAFAVTGLVAAAGGLLSVWYQGRIAPSSIAIGPTLDILILCVLGGLYSLPGALVGAITFKLLSIFASDIIGPQHTSLLTGAAFLLVMMFSNGGIVGVLQSASKRIVLRGASSSPPTETERRK